MKLRADARDIHRAILNELRRRIRMNGALRFLEEFRLISRREEILRRQAYLREGFSKIKPGLGELLKIVRPIRFRKEFLHDRVLIVEEDEVEKAEELGLCEVSTEPLDYPLVLSTVGLGIDVELKPHHVAPELYVLPLWENRDTLKALDRIGKLTGEGSVAGQILRELERIEPIMEKLKLVETLDELVAEEERRLNEAIERRLEKFQLTLSGKELIEFLKSLKEGDIDDLLARFSGLSEEILEEIRRAEKRLSERLGIDAELFPRDAGYPIEVPSEKIEALREALERELKLELYLESRRIIERILPLLPRLRRDIERAEELEFLRAVKEFSEGFTFPEIVEGGVGFVEGRHLFIENPQPVSYFVGKARKPFEGVMEANVLILTGANSGGKTSLLELMTQVVILAHMGLPVPARNAWVEPLGELFFFRRKRSSYGAGAFETALKGFVKALKGSGRKLILIDEFEAITEPGAAVKIIAELLRIAQEKGFYVVIVSHLGENLKRELPFARVDGIEASGLDENLNLIVDRQPKFGQIGKSTPELIVERLVRTSRGEERKVFERILRRFR
ncbi:MutS family DNA mismatch repair protein [Pyrococcus yayanosii]|uniref:DNA-binding protein MutS2 n=1 Tax=Pyrococcus yayanosii (strain CH1 / JCM 16557) TaxID=529709 RepID=F8AIB0_PYRYC|nr:DNA mismatch repair protein [Pyrococcus yayanosii]AEH25513.1 MutS-like DNA mismatch repair ATPase [Pyrococcus yayanosii CH1]